MPYGWLALDREAGISERKVRSTANQRYLRKLTLYCGEFVGCCLAAWLKRTRCAVLLNMDETGDCPHVGDKRTVV